MSKKIVITGGLGYIGTELCKIYSGVSWNNEILVIDNRFVSERVNQLRNWSIDFVHGDILDKDLVNKFCRDADIVHHLAGVTDVPRVKSDSTEDNDHKIKLVAEEGTKNIIDSVGNKCKIIFPSTHVVFEGMEKIKNNILENEDTKPLLSYASSKANNEKQLKNSGKNYLMDLKRKSRFPFISCNIFDKKNKNAGQHKDLYICAPNFEGFEVVI